MADVDDENRDDQVAAARRRRRARQEAMERMLLEGERREDDDDALNDDDDDDDNHNNENDVDDDDDRAALDAALARQVHHPHANVNAAKTTTGLSYTTASFGLAGLTLWWALRTREQWYLALVFLGSSKVAYCVWGNALVAAAVVTFDRAVRVFLDGLRVMEAEGLQDFFRWNVTETCLALTMFRSELTITVAIQFLALILVKCLHHVAGLRGQHLRMTDDAVRGATTPTWWWWWWSGNNNNDHDDEDNDARVTMIPVIPWHHIKVLAMLCLLQSVDLMAVQYMAGDLLNSGPSVSILFAFEAAIAVVSAWSAILLWFIHVTDGLLHFWHEQQCAVGQRLLHPWKEYKATLTFAVELQAQAVQFLFYLAFFGFVMTYYGMPINLFREVYVSFMALKERLWAFLKYRRLMAGMNRFTTPTAEQLDEAGRVCIICRDEMTTRDCKALPVCQHMFHKSCLREWLTQQQSCPTCRSDIASMEARQAAVAAANQRQEPPPEAAPEEEEPPAPERPPPEAVRPPRRDERRGRQQTPADDDGNVVAQHDAVAEPRTTEPQPETRPTAVSPPPSPPVSSETPATPVVPRTATLPEPTPVFPALYRVVRERGAVVWNAEDESVIRRIPLGVVLFGRKVRNMTIADETADFVQIPDGWVADEAVMRVYEGLPTPPTRSH